MHNIMHLRSFLTYFPKFLKSFLLGASCVPDCRHFIRNALKAISHAAFNARFNEGLTNDL